MDLGSHSSPYEIDPLIERRYQLQRRSDLANAFGIVISVPLHGQDEQGNWRYGLSPQYGWPNQDIEAEFAREMRSLISSRARRLAASGIISPEQAIIEEHPYSVGPAAQEWPKLFFELYQDARPYLSDGASLLAWGYFFIDVVRGIWAWASDTERKQASQSGSDSTIYMGTSVMPGIVLTRPAIVALCYTDLIDRHGVTGDVTIDTFPRSLTSYATPDHPGGPETYLVRAKAGRRTFFYLLDGRGKVLEHYSLAGATLTLLSLPNFMNQGVSAAVVPRDETADEADYETRQALPPQTIKIRASQTG